MEKVNINGDGERDKERREREERVAFHSSIGNKVHSYLRILVNTVFKPTLISLFCFSVKPSYSPYA